MERQRQIASPIVRPVLNSTSRSQLFVSYNCSVPLRAEQHCQRRREKSNVKDQSQDVHGYSCHSTF